jgi:hypothetical protein
VKHALIKALIGVGVQRLIVFGVVAGLRTAALIKPVFGDNKPACKQCPVHCYQPAKREEMKQIMRWAGLSA